MNAERLIIIVCLLQTLLIFGLAWRQVTIQNALTRYQARVVHLEDEQEAHLNAWRQMRSADLAHIDQTLAWPNLKPVLGEAGEGPKQGYHFVVYFSELSCNICQDRMSEFSEKLSEKLPGISVTAVIHASHQSYVHQYIRANQVSFDVHFDEHRVFEEINDLIQSPVAFLLYDNRVLAAHYPSPSFPSASDAFYTAVWDRLDR